MTISFGFDQILDSDIAVPGAIPGDDMATGARNIRISVGPEHPNTDAPLYARMDDALLFNASNIASYRCQPDSIQVYPCPGSDPEWVTSLLIATAIPAVLWMQGRFVLHAAAIVPKGASQAIAIAGPSGAGKSVLTRQLLERGASLLADDSVALEVTDDGTIASGLPGGIHRRTGHGDDRRFEPVAPECSVRSAPLGAIILLDDLAGTFASTTLGKLTAVEKIIACQHRPRVPAALGSIGAALAQAAAIADHIPVSIWRRRAGGMTLSAMEQDALSAMLQQQVSL